MAYLHKTLAYPNHDDASIVNPRGRRDQHVQGGRGNDGESKHSENEDTGIKTNQKHYSCFNGAEKVEEQPVGSESLTDKSSGDLCDDVAPEKRAVDHSHRLWVPRELSSLIDGDGDICNSLLTFFKGVDPELTSMTGFFPLKTV